MLALIVCFGAVYGAVLGSYGGEAGPRVLQIIYSAIKVPLLLGATFALSLPSFFVVNTLFGFRARFRESLRALVSAQACLTIALASFAPVTLLWYVSWNNYDAALLFNAAMFGSASAAAQILLRRLYAPLILGHPRQRLLLRAWLTIYAFVGIQMAWLLRPFVGSPVLETHFFRPGAWGNAYVEVVRIASRFLSDF